MATLPNTEELWSVREYLRTNWSPDREYVDGRIEERIIDPEPRIAYLYVDHSLQEVKEAELAVVGTPIRVVLSEMFAELDRA